MSSFSSFIARRYFTGRKRMFSSFLSCVAVMGVALGVFAMVVVMSVMIGFGRDLQQKLMGFNAHLAVEGVGDFRPVLDSLGGLVSASAVVVDGEGIVEIPEGGAGMAQGVKIRGMERGDFAKLKGIEWYLPYAGAKEGGDAVLGSELALQLGLHPDYADKIRLVVPIGRVGPAGEMIPQKMTFIAGGMFKSGYFEHDSKTVIISREDASRLLGGSGREALHIWLNDFNGAAVAAEKIRRVFPSAGVFTWADANKKLFAALTLERIAMSVLLLLIVAIASISIISVIFVYVFARRRDIAILSSIGASAAQIRGIFIKIGAYIGLLGTVIGLLLGIGVCLYLKEHNIPLPSSYYLDHLPVVISRPFLAVVAVCGVLLSTAAAFYPASQATGLKPQELLRYE